MGAPLLKRATLMHWIDLEGEAANPAMIKNKYKLPESLALASRCNDYYECGFLTRATPPEGKAKTVAGKPSAWWKITKAGRQYINESADEVQSVEELQALLAERYEGGKLKEEYATGKRPYVKKGAATPAIALNKKANAAVDGISQLIEDYNKSHALLLQIGAMINAYMKDNQAEIVEE